MLAAARARHRDAQHQRLGASADAQPSIRSESAPRAGSLPHGSAPPAVARVLRVDELGVSERRAALRHRAARRRLGRDRRISKCVERRRRAARARAMATHAVLRDVRVSEFARSRHLGRASDVASAATSAGAARFERTKPRASELALRTTRVG